MNSIHKIRLAIKPLDVPDPQTATLSIPLGAGKTANHQAASTTWFITGTGTGNINHIEGGTADDRLKGGAETDTDMPQKWSFSRMPQSTGETGQKRKVSSPLSRLGGMPSIQSWRRSV